MGLAPFAFLTILLVEFFARKQPVSLYRITSAVFISPVLIAIVSVGYIKFRQFTHEGPGVDIGLALTIPIAMTMIVMSLVFSIGYAFLRMDVTSSVENLASETTTKIILLPTLVLLFLFIYLVSFFTA